MLPNECPTPRHSAIVRGSSISNALSVVQPSAIGGAVTGALDRTFGLLDVLALAAVVVAVLGMLDVLLMDVRQRVGELGLLRAAGLTQRVEWRRKTGSGPRRVPSRSSLGGETKIFGLRSVLGGHACCHAPAFRGGKCGGSTGAARAERDRSGRRAR